MTRFLERLNFRAKLSFPKSGLHKKFKKMKKNRQPRKTYFFFLSLPLSLPLSSFLAGAGLAAGLAAGFAPGFAAGLAAGFAPGFAAGLAAGFAAAAISAISASYRWRAAMSISTTSGLARVITLPRSSFVAMAFKMRRMIFPDRVFGTASVNIMNSGAATGPATLRTWAIISCRRLLSGTTPDMQVTNAKMVLPLISWGTGT